MFLGKDMERQNICIIIINKFVAFYNFSFFEKKKMVVRKQKKSSGQKRKKFVGGVKKVGKFVWKHKGKIAKAAAVIGSIIIAAKMREMEQKAAGHAAQPPHHLRHHHTRPVYKIYDNDERAMIRAINKAKGPKGKEKE